MATLEDHLRTVTRNFTAALPEEQVLALARDLAAELVRAHSETPPRHPGLEPGAVEMVEGRPRLGAGAAGSVAEDLLRLGALAHALARGAPAVVSWRLDGPPPFEASTLMRRAALAALGSPQPGTRFSSAEAARRGLDAALAAPDLASAWPLFRGDAARSGARPLPAAPRRLTPLWSTPLGPVVASPALCGGLVLAATQDGRLLVLDRDGGRRVHELKLGSAIESSPALAGRLLYVGTDDGELVAVDVVDGRTAFRVRPAKMLRSSPLPVEDRVLVGLIEPGDAGALIAVDALKGKPIWKRKLGGAVFSSPALSQGHALVGCDDGKLYAVDSATGAAVWSHALGAKVRATPAVLGERVLAADFAGRLVALRAADGERAWLRETGAPIYSSPCAAGELTLVGTNTGLLLASDSATGAARFETATRGPVVASPLALGDRFLAASTDGALYLLDAAGATLERAPVAPAGIQATPAVGDGVVYVGSALGVSALRLDP